MNKELNTEKLGVALGQALDDLEAVEKDERYRVHFGSWHIPKDDGKCQICLAGAVIARRLDIPPSKESCPEDFGRRAAKTLHALDWLRLGIVSSAWHCLHNYQIPLPSNLPKDREIPRYADDRDGFFRELRNLQKELEDAGY